MCFFFFSFFRYLISTPIQRYENTNYYISFEFASVRRDVISSPCFFFLLLLLSFFARGCEPLTWRVSFASNGECLKLRPFRGREVGQLVHVKTLFFVTHNRWRSVKGKPQQFPEIWHVTFGDRMPTDRKPILEYELVPSSRHLSSTFLWQESRRKINYEFWKTTRFSRSTEFRIMRIGSPRFSLIINIRKGFQTLLKFLLPSLAGQSYRIKSRTEII